MKQVDKQMKDGNIIDDIIKYQRRNNSLKIVLKDNIFDFTINNKCYKKIIGNPKNITRIIVNDNFIDRDMVDYISKNEIIITNLDINNNDDYYSKIESEISCEDEESSSIIHNYPKPADEPPTSTNPSSDEKPDISKYLIENNPIFNISYYTQNYSNSDKQIRKDNHYSNQVLPDYDNDNSAKVNFSNNSDNSNNSNNSNNFGNNTNNRWDINDKYIQNILDQKDNYCPVIMGNANGYGEFKSQVN